MMKNKPIIVNSSILVALSFAIYAAYYLLLHDNCLHSSISSIFTYATHFNIKQRLVVLGLLPVYISAMIFGAAILGIYMGSKLTIFLDYVMKKVDARKYL